jgi:xanthine dehydrogenase accessory factor
MKNGANAFRGFCFSEKNRNLETTLGISEKALARLHAPIGLPIGSHTPPEIAIAILAEMTAVRNG